AAFGEAHAVTGGAARPGAERRAGRLRSERARDGVGRLAVGRGRERDAQTEAERRARDEQRVEASGERNLDEARRADAHRAERRELVREELGEPRATLGDDRERDAERGVGADEARRVAARAPFEQEQRFFDDAPELGVARAIARQERSG